MSAAQDTTPPWLAEAIAATEARAQAERDREDERLARERWTRTLEDAGYRVVDGPEVHRGR